MKTQRDKTDPCLLAASLSEAGNDAMHSHAVYLLGAGREELGRVIGAERLEQG
jgi:hypothetical protein